MTPQHPDRLPDPIDISKRATPPPAEVRRPEHTETVPGPGGGGPIRRIPTAEENPFQPAEDEGRPTAAEVSDFARATIPSQRPAPAGASTSRRASMAEPNRLGQYRIVRELGRGGMGVVYEGIQDKLERRVALKVLPEHLARNEDLVARFLVEARAVARFHHPNIAAIYEIAEEDGVHFFAMEFVGGRTLSDLIVKRDLESIDDCVRIVRDTARALDYAHKAGVIHRDIKPSNIMITSQGEVKIMDFGLARLEGDDRLTQTGMTLGTPAYMSPEQAGSKLAGPIDRRSDIYSLGVVLFEALTQRIPFDGRSKLEILRNIVDEKVPPPRKFRADIPKELETIVLRALAKRTDERYQTARDLADALESFLAERKPHAAISRVHRPLDRRVLLGVAAATAVVALAAGWWLSRSLSDAGEARIAASGTAGAPAGTASTSPDAGGGAALSADALLAAGRDWEAGVVAATLAHELDARGADPATPDAIVATVSSRFAERFAAERDAFDDAAAAADLLRLYELRALRATGRGLVPPQFPSDATATEGPAPSAAPSGETADPAARLAAWLDHLLAAPPEATEALLAWCHGLGGKYADHEHHILLGALARRGEASHPGRAAVALLVLAEEAPRASAQRARVASLLALMKRHGLDHAALERAAAAWRPVVDWRPEALGWGEVRPLLREALRPVTEQGWERVTAASLVDRFAALQAEGRSAFRGDFLALRPEPSSPPRAEYQRAPGAEPVALAPRVVDPRAARSRRRVVELHPPARESFGLTLPAEPVAFADRYVTPFPIGDGAEQWRHLLVEVSPDRRRWVVMLDADGDKAFDDETPLHPFAAIVPDHPLVARFQTLMPLALRFHGVEEAGGKIGLALDVVSAREGLLADGSARAAVRLFDLNSDGVFDDVEATAEGTAGALLTLLPLEGPHAALPAPLEPVGLGDAMTLGAGDLAARQRVAGTPEEPLGLTRGIAPFDLVVAPGDCLELVRGRPILLQQIAPGGGTLYVRRNAVAPLRGAIYDGRTNRPIAGARVTLRYANFSRTLTAGEQGRLAEDVPLGRCSVRVEAEGYAPMEAPAVVLSERILEKFDFGLLPAEEAPASTPAAAQGGGTP